MAEITDISWADRLRTEGVNCKGYGSLPKYVMMDRSLTIKSKAIYAYLRSLSGSGETAFPSVATICRHLACNKDTYYKHFEPLVQQGYLVVSKSRSQTATFANNVYTFVDNPKKFSEENTAHEELPSKIYGVIRYRGLLGAGYGIIPRSVMLDNRLDINAKALYAYFAGYTGSGESAFPARATILYHLKIGKDAYSKYLKLLTETNYITVQQRRQNGSLGVNDYYLNSNPDTAAVKKEPKEDAEGKKKPYPKKQDTAKQDTVKSEADKAEAVKTEAAISEAGKPDTTIPSLRTPSSFIHSFSNISPIYQDMTGPIEKSAEDLFLEEELRAVACQPAEDISILIKDQLDYDSFGVFYPDIPQAFLDILISIVTNVIAKQQDVKVGGEVVSWLPLAKKLYSLTASHIQYVWERVSAAKTPIKNVRAYYLTCMYNTPDDADLYYEEQAMQEYLKDSTGF